MLAVILLLVIFSFPKWKPNRKKHHYSEACLEGLTWKRTHKINDIFWTKGGSTNNTAIVTSHSCSFFTAASQSLQLKFSCSSSCAGIAPGTRKVQKQARGSAVMEAAYHFSKWRHRVKNCIADVWFIVFFALNSFHLQWFGEGSSCGQSPFLIPAFCLHLFIEQRFPSASPHAFCGRCARQIRSHGS